MVKWVRRRERRPQVVAWLMRKAAGEGCQYQVSPGKACGRELVLMDGACELYLCERHREEAARRQLHQCRRGLNVGAS